MGLKTWFANKLLDHAFRGVVYNAPANWYLGVSSTVSNPDGTGFTEPAGGNYARDLVPVGAADFAAATAGATSNLLEQAFLPTTAAWSTAGAPTLELGLFEAAAGGLPAWTGPVRDVPDDGVPGVVIGAGRIPTVPVGELDISFECE